MIISATNTSMNAEESVWNQTKTISDKTYKDTTSDESLKNMAIAGITAGIVAGVSAGISELSGASNASTATNTASASSQLPTSLESSTTLTANTGNFSGNVVNGGNSLVISNSLTNSTALTERFLNALQESAIQTVSATAAQSAVNGDSFSEALRNQTKNLIINAVGQVLANEIGSAYHNGEYHRLSNSHFMLLWVVLWLQLEVIIVRLVQWQE